MLNKQPSDYVTESIRHADAQRDAHRTVMRNKYRLKVGIPLNAPRPAPIVKRDSLGRFIA